MPLSFTPRCLQHLSRLLLAGALPFFTLASSGMAHEFTTKVSDIAPTESVIESIAGEESGNFRWFSFLKAETAKGASQRNFAQTFHAPGKAGLPLHGVALQVASFEKAVGGGALNAPVRISLYKGSAPADGGKEEPLFTTTGRLPEMFGSGDYLTFQFDQSVEITGGQRYFLVFSFESPAEGQSINLTAGGTRSYSGGQAYFFTQEASASEPKWGKSQCDALLLLLSAP